MSEISKVDFVPANSIQSLLKRYGTDPIFLIKTYEKEKYAEEARNGKFYANSIEWFRNNGTRGQNDMNESAVEELFFFTSKDSDDPQSVDVKPVFSPEKVSNKDIQIKDVSLICFFWDIS